MSQLIFQYYDGWQSSSLTSPTSVYSKYPFFLSIYFCNTWCLKIFKYKGDTRELGDPIRRQMVKGLRYMNVVQKFCESIPQSLLQAYHLIKRNNFILLILQRYLLFDNFTKHPQTFQQVFPIVSLAVAIISGSLTFKDINPKYQEYVRKIYSKDIIVNFYCRDKRIILLQVFGAISRIWKYILWIVAFKYFLFLELGFQYLFK